MSLTRRVMNLGAALGLALLALATAAPAAHATVVHYATGWAKPCVHYRVASTGRWTAPPGLPMADEGAGWFVFDTGRDRVSELVFSDGGRRWDAAPGGGNYVAGAAATEIWVRDGRVTLAPPGPGRIEETRVPSTRLAAPRRVRVYLPAGYDRRLTTRYPVLYLHDGQNLFDRNAFWGGWQVDAALEATTQAGTVGQMIVVGIDNSAARMTEYTPVRDATYGGGGADRYLDFVVKDLKPWVDRNYRTKPEAASTGIGGSSLGGLLSLHAGFTRPATFGRVLAMSPSLWWGNRALTRSVRAWSAAPPIKVYLDSGGPSDGSADVLVLRDLLQAKGLASGARLWYRTEPAHEHDEAAWRARLPGALQVLFPR